jgi:integrator complex subunit 1
LEAIEEAENSGDDENIEKVLCGAVKYLRANRSKPEQAMYLGLMYLAKTRPSFFHTEIIVEVLYFAQFNWTIVYVLPRIKQSFCFI